MSRIVPHEIAADHRGDQITQSQSFTDVQDSHHDLCDHLGACHFGHCQNHVLPSSILVPALRFNPGDYGPTAVSIHSSPFLEGLRRPPRT